MAAFRFFFLIRKSVLYERERSEWLGSTSKALASCINEALCSLPPRLQHVSPHAANKLCVCMCVRHCEKVCVEGTVTRGPKAKVCCSSSSSSFFWIYLKKTDTRENRCYFTFTLRFCIFLFIFDDLWHYLASFRGTVVVFVAKIWQEMENNNIHQCCQNRTLVFLHL